MRILTGASGRQDKRWLKGRTKKKKKKKKKDKKRRRKFSLSLSLTNCIVKEERREKKIGDRELIERST